MYLFDTKFALPQAQNSYTGQSYIYLSNANHMHAVVAKHKSIINLVLHLEKNVLVCDCM